MRIVVRCRWGLCLQAACAPLAPIVGAHLDAQVPTSGADTATATPGRPYERGGSHRFLLGTDYRDLWTTPLRAEVLDLTTFAGGLTTVGTGGGFQTLQVRFVGADGRPYTFRGLDKDPSDVLPEELQDEKFITDLVRDQTHAAFPTAPLVTSVLANALGILHSKPKLVILPDDPRLGEFQEPFHGKLGILIEWPNEGPDDTPGFAGATEVLSTDELDSVLVSSPSEAIDTSAFLVARLFDVLIGDWDRHRGQWRWANVGDGDPPVWVPIPEDRDQAFVRYDGMIMTLARPQAPQFLKFGEELPGVFGATWHGTDLDRRYLVGVPEARWDSAAGWMEQRLTNDVIDTAVRQLPPPHYDLRGEELARKLKARRDGLRSYARTYYRFLARKVDVHLSDAAEVVDALWLDGGDLEIRAAAATQEPRTARGGTPYYVRRFTPAETDEVRVYLNGGDDEVRVSGDGGSRIRLRVISESGSNRVIDSSDARRTKVYDPRGVGGVDAGQLGVDDRDFVEVDPKAGTYRDWVWLRRQSHA